MLQATWDWYYGSTEEELLGDCQFGEPFSRKNSSNDSDIVIRPGTYENGDSVNVFTAKSSNKLEIAHLEICSKVKFRVFLRSHCKQFLFVKLTRMPLCLLLLLKRYFFSWFLLYSILALKGGFWVSFTKNITYDDFLKIPKFVYIWIVYFLISKNDY